MSRKTGARWIDLVVLLAYVVLSLAMSYPLPLHMRTHVAGRHMDTRVFQWNNWWVREAVLKGLDLDYTDRIYTPSGVSLVSHNFNWISSFLSVPLDLLFGPAVAYNLTFLLTLVLSGYGTYLLVRDLVHRRDAAFVAGLVYAFAPYHLSGNWDGQMNLANTQWIPLAMLYVLRTLEAQRVRDAVLSGVFVAASSLDCWFFMVFLGMWGVLFGAYTLIWERGKWRWRTVWLYLLAAAVFALLVSPFALPLIRESGQGTVDSALGYYEDEKSTDLLAFLVPSRDHPLLSRPFDAAYQRFTHWRPAFLGYSLSALAAYAVLSALRERDRRAILWLASGLAFAALSLGTVLRVNGVAYPAVPTPYRLLTDVLPALKIVRQANRFSVMVSLSLAVLVGLACADLFRRLRRWRTVAASLASALVLFEYLAVPCPLLSNQVSPFYHDLAREEGDFAIVELPLEVLYSRRSLHAQTVHGKRLVNGYTARLPPGAEAFIRSTPMLKAFSLRMAPDPALHDVPAELGILAANDIRYIVIHKTPLPPHPAVQDDVLASWRALLGPDPAYEDGEIVVYRTALAPGQGLAPIVRLGELGLTGVQAQRTRILDRAFLAVDLSWTALSDPSHAYGCALSLVGPAGDVVSAGRWDIVPHYPTSRWVAGVVVAERYALPLDPALPAGAYRLAISVVDVASGQELSSGEVPLQVQEVRPFVPALNDMQHPVGATFGEQMWLLGYSQRQEGDRLVLDMYWQAMRTIEANFKIFVHLVRPEDGAILSQQDVMPRGWSYPTSLWDRYEVFVDRVDLPLGDVAPGAYALAVGVYDPERGRLTALDANGRPVPEDRLFVSERVQIVKPQE